jgi:hypothetical protein
MKFLAQAQDVAWCAGMLAHEWVDGPFLLFGLLCYEQ